MNNNLGVEESGNFLSVDPNGDVIPTNIEVSNVTDLQDRLDGKADKATTLAGYGITDAASKTYVDELIDGLTTEGTADAALVQAALNAHTNDKANPHAVTAAQVGLGNVNNTSDADKPISTATQAALDGKASTSHGTHVNYSSTTPVMDGTASVGSANTVARSDHKHPVDTSRASKTEFDSHVSNETHITAAERTNWDAAKTHADSAHAPSDAQKNQNAFSNIAVSGQTTVAADTTTDTVTFVGSNVSITTDATNDKVTFSVADGTTSTKGVVQLTDSTSSTSKTTAATPNSVKSAYDLANTAKTNAATAQTRADNAYTLADGKANTEHTHTMDQIDELQTTLNNALQYIESSVAQKTQVQIIKWEEND